MTSYWVKKKAVQTRNHSATIQVSKLSGYLALYAYDILFTDINGNLRLYSFTFDSIPTHPFSRISRYLKVQKHVSKHCGYYRVTTIALGKLISKQEHWKDSYSQIDPQLMFIFSVENKANSQAFFNFKSLLCT